MNPQALHTSITASDPSAPLSCLVVEDQAMFLDLLAATLDQIPGLRIVGRASTAMAAIQAAEALHPDLLILDLDLPDAPGTEVAAALQRCRPDARLIVLSGQASSFVCPAPLESMLQAVIDKTNAYRELHQELAALIPASRPSHSPIDRLTPREREILRLIGEGLSSKRIAGELAITTDTVQTHRRHISSKLGMAGAELIRTAVLYGSTPKPDPEPDIRPLGPEPERTLQEPRR